MTYDAIVLGIGGMGSAAAYHLARRGARVLGLEQFDVPHDRGSSHGVTRIIRLAYAEHPSYVPLLRRAYALWRDLERAHGERLLVVTGGLDLGRADSGVVAGSRRSCELHDLPHEVLTGPQINARFPGYGLPGDFLGVLQPEGGFVLAERGVVAHVEAAHAAGAEIRAREGVLAWEAGDRGVGVRTTRGEYRARRLVITAGPWASRCVPALAGLARPERQVLLFTQPRTPAHFRPDRFPVFNMGAPDGHFYGLPIHGVPGFKIGLYNHRREQVDPDTVDRAVHAEDEAVLRAGIARYFPDADGPTLAMTTCLFTNSPDEHFILDRHPAEPAVTIAAGFSGHGYKFCSVVGEVMADLALDGGSRHDLALFRLDRFSSAAQRKGEGGLPRPTLP
jgi:sarcosine oxidase